MEHPESTPTPSLAVRTATPAEFDHLLPVCVEAFADEAVSAWVEPVPALRLERTRTLFQDSLRAAVDAGELLVAFLPDGEPVAASLWTDLESGLPEPPAGPTPTHRADQRIAVDQRLAVGQRLAVVLAATGERHPREPHVYLSAMAALPGRRGLGAGSAMLRHGLGRARRLGLPVYLEASTPRNRRLYARHGFRDLGDPIRLPEDGPALQPMWHR